MYHKIIHNEFHETIKLTKKLIHKKNYIDAIQSSAKIISETFKIGGKVLSCGNGGSHCNAMHFAEELTGRYRNNRIGYAAIAISDPSYLSCVGNDFGYKHIFSRYIEAVGQSKDILFAISASGQSENILNAINAAYNKGMKIIFLTRENLHNKNPNHANIEICVPYSRYLDYIQEVHIKIIHTIILIIEKEMLL